MRSVIEFEGFAGTILRGWLYQPKDVAASVPAIVMAHGLSATKHMGLDAYAAEFMNSGFAVLLYDHRNLGNSDGQPRQQINPWAQARDYRYAIGFLSELTFVDAQRIGIWGSSFSGGEVLVVGACDSRVKAIVANVPLAGFDGVDYSDTQIVYQAMRDSLLDESGNGLADKIESQLGPVQIVKENGVDEVLLGQAESADWYLGEGNTPGSFWLNAATLVNCLGEDSLWDPAQCIAHIAPPLLMVIATDDTLCSTAVAKQSYERASQPKEMLLIEGHHFMPYSGEALELACKTACWFFTEHLCVEV